MTSATGYVHPVLDGEHDFQHFVWSAARAMGALVHLRDCGGREVTYPQGGGGWYVDEAARLRAVLDQLTAFDAYTVYLHEQHVKQCAEVKRAREEAEIHKRRWEEVYGRVVDWDPPTKEHVAFKEFMLQQLKMTSWYEHGDPDPVPQDPTELRSAHKQCLETLANQLQSVEEKISQLTALQDERTAWIKALHQNIPVPQEWNLLEELSE
jgi:hypothetical protein